MLRRKKAPAPPAFSWGELLGEMTQAFAAMQSGGAVVIPEAKDVKGTLVRAVFALLDTYVETDGKLARAIDDLAVAFSNRSDPMLSRMGFVEHAGAWAMINALRQRRRAIHGTEKAG